PGANHLDAIHLLSLQQAIAIPGVEHSRGEVRRPGDHGHRVAHPRPPAAVLIGPHRGSIRLRREIMADKENAHRYLSRPCLTPADGSHTRSAPAAAPPRSAPRPRSAAADRTPDNTTPAMSRLPAPLRSAVPT